VIRTHATRATIGSEAKVGPFVVLAEGTRVAPGTTVGPFSSLDS
jgi:bifunctional N-acetylglucosamine-1-phosphate-uridyltransferase/glucosamine-1-phosphate-acetyltransferase GlmU-like protein